MATGLIRMADLASGLLAVVAKLSLAIIVVAVTADAAGRYLWSAPILGVQAIVEGLLQPTVVFFAAALTGRRNGHMKVEILPVQRMPRFKVARDILWSLLITLFWSACAWQAGSHAYAAWLAGQWPVGEIAVPVIFSSGVTCIGCAMAAFAHAVPLSRQEDVAHAH